MQEEQPLQVARCTKIIQSADDPDKAKYVINVKQIAKFVVNLGERVSPTDIEEGMRVGFVLGGRCEMRARRLLLTDDVAVSTAKSTKSFFRCRPESTLLLP